MCRKSRFSAPFFWLVNFFAYLCVRSYALINTISSEDYEKEHFTKHHQHHLHNPVRYRGGVGKSKLFLTMAKVRIPINPLQVGRVGAYTMYVREGEQIVRQRKNSSNYGESASRTLAQTTRRARWGNLVNSFKAMKFWQPKAWEGLKPGVTDYNAFMSANINSTPIYLTKDMVANGCAVMDNFVLSKGSLIPIDGGWDSADNAFTTAIVTTAAVSATTTVAQLSADIINNNAGFLDGDNIAYIRFYQQFDDRGYPYLRSVYEELTLDLSSAALLSTKGIYPLISAQTPANLFLLIPAMTGWDAVGAIAIHTRKGSGLQVSTQQMVVTNTTYIDAFSSESARTAAIDSYGVDADVPLEPSFESAAFESVTINGSPYGIDGLSYSGSVTLRVSGKNVQSSAQLLRDGNLVTPSQSSASSVEWTVSDVGSYRLMEGGSLFGFFQIEVPLPLAWREDSYLTSRPKTFLVTNSGAAIVLNIAGFEQPNLIGKNASGSIDLYNAREYEQDTALFEEWGVSYVYATPVEGSRELSFSIGGQAYIYDAAGKTLTPAVEGDF